MKLTLPTVDQEIEKIKAGDLVLLSGRLYSGRDQVHKILFSLIKEEKNLPFLFAGEGIYYMGPSPAPDGFIMGAAGPTTSARMDPYSSTLIENGLKIMIGKGPRSQEVKESVKKYKGLYLQAFGGCGALYSTKIKSAKEIAYSFLGPEALLELYVEDFPTLCILDSSGNEYKV